eukprot:CAMPEP_0195078438 /NCGR_PEP_ID=MMETSP0448-20130528/20628_1 /TAXON_ID=66468 /ORGANISM="Heterocapsa triquestra, Strain CCMP 448" /LENGTH=52 /DNA_ID=CAMNT_0040111179 /DNA_START=100 /DNA_END=258 /DNA_ORIENTATION=-
MTASCPSAISFTCSMPSRAASTWPCRASKSEARKPSNFGSKARATADFASSS